MQTFPFKEFSSQSPRVTAFHSPLHLHCAPRAELFCSALHKFIRSAIRRMRENAGARAVDMKAMGCRTIQADCRGLTARVCGWAAILLEPLLSPVPESEGPGAPVVVRDDNRFRDCLRGSKLRSGAEAHTYSARFAAQLNRLLRNYLAGRVIQSRRFGFARRRFCFLGGG